MFQDAYTSANQLATLILLLLTLHGASAGPVTIGMSSTAAMVGAGGTYLNPLVIVLPMAGAAFLVLLLAVCCCSFRRRRGGPRNLRTSKVSNRATRRNAHYGLGLIPASRMADGYTYLSTSTNGDIPPPYSPRSSSPSLYGESSLAEPMRFPGSPLPSISLDDVEGQNEEGRKLLNAPSPLVSRTGSPSLQIWTPPLPSSIRAQHSHSTSSPRN
jgi:hypothetical protein